MIRVLLSLLLVVGSLAAAEPSPREQVLRLVPPDSAVCFVVQNLREQAQTVANSPFAAWASAKLAPTIKENADAKKIQQVEQFVTSVLGISLKDMRDDILGDCVALAYQPGPPGQPSEERGVVLIYARKPEKLQTLIDTFNKLQKQSGEIADLKEHRYGERVYFERARGHAASEFYFIHEHIFAFAVHKDVLKAIIDREASRDESPVLKSLDALKLQNAFLACWLNPRKLDADLASRPNTTAAEKAGRAQMAKLWSAVDQCAFYLAASKDLELGLAMTYRAEAMPPELKAQFEKAPVPSALWSSIPNDAIFAVAANVEMNSLLSLIASFLPESERPAFRAQIEKAIVPLVGEEKLQAVIDGIGPEVGVWAVKSPKDGGPLPCVTLASRINRESDTLMQTVNFYAQMLRFDYNRNHNDQIAVAETKRDGVELHTFTNDALFPPKVRPTYSYIGDYLVLASNPESVTAFKAPTTPPASADVPLARISGTALRDQITSHRDGLAKFLATHQDRNPTAIGGDLDNFATVLEAFDKAELLVRGDNRSRTFAVKVQLVKSLK